jgi:hypothetical protein
MKRTKDELLQSCLKQFTHMDFVNENKTLNTTKSLIMEIEKAINYTHSCTELCDKCNKENHLQKLTDQAQDLGLGYD